MTLRIHYPAIISWERSTYEGGPTEWIVNDGSPEARAYSDRPGFLTVRTHTGRLPDRKSLTSDRFAWERATAVFANIMNVDQDRPR